MAKPRNSLSPAKRAHDYVDEMDGDDESEFVPSVKKGRGRSRKMKNGSVSRQKDSSLAKKNCAEKIVPDVEAVTSDTDNDVITPKSRGRPKKIKGEKAATPSRGSSRPKKAVNYSENNDDDDMAPSRGRGRPKKTVNYSDSSDDDYHAVNYANALTPASRGCGRPKKTVNYSENNASDDENDMIPTSASRGRGRPRKMEGGMVMKSPGRGRPRKQQTNTNSQSMSLDDDSLENYLSEDASSANAASSDEAYVKKYDKKFEAGQKRRRRKKTTSPKVKLSVSKENISANAGHKIKLITCVHCDQEVDRTKISYHLIRLHHLVRTRDEPDGVCNLERVIQVLGKVTCKDCETTFYDLPTYKSHLDACSGELLINPLHKMGKTPTFVDGPVTCVHCNICAPSRRQIEYHMLSIHYRVWRPNNHEGVLDLTYALKRFKKLVCNKCRKRLYVVSAYETHMETCTGEQVMPVTGYRGRGRPRDVDSTGKKRDHVDRGKCLRCNMDVPEKKMFYHMIRDHHLVWSLSHPEGVPNLERVIMSLGKVECKDCGKMFYNVPTYRSHLKSCRGELLKGAQRAKGRPPQIANE